MIAIWDDHLRHLLRDDLNMPSFFLTNSSMGSRETLKKFLAHSVFDYIIPKLDKMEPEQILEVREK